MDFFSEDVPIPIPDEYLCPITQKIMKDPVSTCDGETYEREQIQKWLTTKQTSPRTNVVLVDKTLRPNVPLKRLITKFIEDHSIKYPQLLSNVYLPESIIQTFCAFCQQGKHQDIKRLLSDKHITRSKMDDDKTILHLASRYADSVDTFQLVLDIWNSMDVNNNLTQYLLEPDCLGLNCVHYIAYYNASSHNIAILRHIHEFVYEAQRKLAVPKQMLDILQALKQGQNVQQLVGFQQAMKKLNLEFLECVNVNSILHTPNMNDSILNKSVCSPTQPLRKSSLQDSNSFVQFTLQKHLERMELLLNLGVDINVDEGKGTALHMAVRSRYGNAITLWLLSHGAHPSARCNRQPGEFTPLHIAAREGNEFVIQYLLAKEVNLNETCDPGNCKGYTALHLASRNGHAKAIEILLKHKADVNALAYNTQFGDLGCTPLFLACVYEHMEAIAQLLQFDAKLMIVQNGIPVSFSVPHYAVKHSVRQLDLLLEGRRTQIESLVDHEKRTLLHCAAQYADKLWVEKILFGYPEVLSPEKIGNFINAQDVNGDTALHLAVKSNQEPVALLLMELGANIKLKNKYGKTPLDEAVTLHYNSMITAINNKKMQMKQVMLHMPFQMKVLQKKVEEQASQVESLNRQLRELEFMVRSLFPKPSDG